MKSTPTIIDTCGKLCPEPLIITKRAITDAVAGSCFEVVSDNQTSRTNLMSYLSALGFVPVCEDVEGRFHITFTINRSISPSNIAAVTESIAMECACETTQNSGKYAIVIRSRTMGSGDDDLGALLMRSCINSLGELDVRPSLVVLYNSGVMLATAGTDTANSLRQLNDSGVEVLVCGTCIDFFGVKDQLVVGTVSNMLSINNALSKASHIIYP